MDCFQNYPSGGEALQLNRTVVVSFEARDGKWYTETYDSSKLPETLEEGYGDRGREV